MPLVDVLDLARWAPSGDNTQPWRFSISEPDRVAVHAHDTREHCVYDLDGHASQVAVGALLETIELAATRYGLAASTRRRPESPDERPVFDVVFRRNEGGFEHPLVREIERRRVQRRPMQLRSLSPAERERLEQSVAGGFEIRWFEGWRARASMAWLNYSCGRLRYTVPEAYEVHRNIIEWNARYSNDRVPDGAIGAGALTLALMRWAMASWDRVSFLNRYLGGTLLPGIELDVLPGLACAAHCVLLAPQAPQRLEDYVEAGRALQRFWLTATSLDLQFQPEYTPLVFARYAREQVQFTTDDRALAEARKLQTRLRGLVGETGEMRAMFMGRIGAGPAADARSTRLSVESLTVPN